MEKSQTLEISWQTIIKVFIAIFVFYLVYIVKEIALWFLFGLAISVLLEPAINFFKKLYFPKYLAIFTVYFLIFGILGLLIYLTAPIFVFELKQLSQSLPGYLEQISPALKQIGFDMSQTFDDFTSFLTGNLVQSSKSIIKAIMIFFGGVSSAVFILTISFFLSLEERGTEKFLILVTPKKYEETIITLFERAQRRVAGWFGARLLACLFVGLASFIIFYIFGIKYAFLLAFISGILNFVPYIGPWITALTLALFVSVSSSSIFMVFYVLASVFAIQAVENNLLTPILMKKMINIPPVLVLVSLLLGAKIFGFLGTIFAVPVFGIIYEFVKEFLERRREEGSQSY